MTRPEEQFAFLALDDLCRGLSATILPPSTPSPSDGQVALGRFIEAVRIALSETGLAPDSRPAEWHAKIADPRIPLHPSSFAICAACWTKRHAEAHADPSGGRVSVDALDGQIRAVRDELEVLLRSVNKPGALVEGIIRRQVFNRQLAYAADLREILAGLTPERALHACAEAGARHLLPRAWDQIALIPLPHRVGAVIRALGRRHHNGSCLPLLTVGRHLVEHPDCVAVRGALERWLATVEAEVGTRRPSSARIPCVRAVVETAPGDALQLVEVRVVYPFGDADHTPRTVRSPDELVRAIFTALKRLRTAAMPTSRPWKKFVLQISVDPEHLYRGLDSGRAGPRTLKQLFRCIVFRPEPADLDLVDRVPVPQQLDDPRREDANTLWVDEPMDAVALLDRLLEADAAALFAGPQLIDEEGPCPAVDAFVDHSLSVHFHEGDAGALAPLFDGRRHTSLLELFDWVGGRARAERITVLWDNPDFNDLLEAPR